MQPTNTEGTGGYQLRLLASKLGNSTEVSGITDAMSHVQTTNPADFPVAIGVGDLDGDGYDDFVGASSTTGIENYVRIFFGGPQEPVDPSSPDFTNQIARNNAVLNRRVLSLKLPAPLSLSGAGSGTFSTITSGDFNADRLADVAVTVSGGLSAGVYAILGRSDAFSIVGSRKLKASDTLPIGATFSLRVDEGPWKNLAITTTSGETNVTLATLLGKLNAAISAAGLTNDLIAEAISSSNEVHSEATVNDRIRLRLLSGKSLQLSLVDSASDPMKTILGLQDGYQNAWYQGLLGNASLDVVNSYDAKVNVATAIGGLVGNVFGTGGIDEPSDIVAGIAGSAPQSTLEMESTNLHLRSGRPTSPIFNCKL